MMIQQPNLEKLMTLMRGQTTRSSVTGVLVQVFTMWLVEKVTLVRLGENSTLVTNLVMTLEKKARKSSAPVIEVMVMQSYVSVTVKQSKTQVITLGKKVSKSLVLEGADLQPLSDVKVNRSTVWVGMRIFLQLFSLWKITLTRKSSALEVVDKYST